MQKAAFAAPPINEIGLSANSVKSGILDPYDIRGMHDAFSGLPIAEKQSTIGALQLAPLVGGGSNGPNGIEGLPNLWWLISSDQSRVLQVQTDFISYNWRRLTSPLMPPDYPGFEAILGEFRARFAELSAWHDARGTELPSPAGCELFYDDIIPLIDSNGQAFRISDALTELHPSAEPRVVSGWTNAWLEPVLDAPEQTSMLRIQIQMLGVALPERSEPLPVLKLAFTAAAARSDWEEVFNFYEVAHAHIRQRFLSLITTEVQATWSP
jgi:uncharacterized protein (TIGR04255 family)